MVDGIFPPALRVRAADVLAAAGRQGLMITTAESCTGGLVAGLLTEIAGSSSVFERGFVTYSNAAKAELLGVPPDLLAQHGAVSEAVARAMAEGALAHAAADLALAVTGIAGPGGGSAEKPVGLVHFALARRGGATVALAQQFTETSRSTIRLAAIGQAIALFEQALGPS